MVSIGLGSTIVGKLVASDTEVGESVVRKTVVGDSVGESAG